MTFVSVIGLANTNDRLLVLAIPCNRHFVEGKINITLQHIGAHLANSFANLEIGGFRIVLIGLTGDLKFHQEFFNAKRYYNRVKLCYKCRALKSSCPLNYFDVNGEWRDNVFSTDEFLTEVGSNPISQVANFHIDMIYIDLMHTVYIGVGEELAGSCIEALFHGGMTIQDMYDSFKAFCSSRGYYTQTDIRSFEAVIRRPARQYPHCKTFKAMDNRWLIAFLGGQTYKSPKLTAAQNAALGGAAYSMQCFLSICDDGGLFLTTGQSEQAHHFGMSFCQLWMYLAQSCLDMDISDFKVKPKFHYFCHLALAVGESPALNPKVMSCFNSEDFVGHMCRIGAKCSPRTMPKRILQRWLLGLMLLRQGK